MENNINELLEKILKDNIYKVILSNKISNIDKVSIEKKNDKYLYTEYIGKNVYHKMNDSIDINKYIDVFKQFNFWSEEYEYMIKISKKGKVFYNRSKNLFVKNKSDEKNYILRPNMKIEPLIDLGIFTTDGKVSSKYYDKYKQINKYIEIIDNMVNEEKLSKINIIDFGCGRSYLTFVVYYYFKYIKNVDVHIIGLDLKENVIEECNKISKKYGYDNLVFEVGDINGFNSPFDVDMVMTLHACDTATDYALYNAIKWNAKYIFSVPCCQKEINKQICSNNKILTRYGIAKERISAIYTDIIRCNLLEYKGYKTDLLEFIDMEGTPKNLLIRAKKSNIPYDIANKYKMEVIELQKEFNFKQKLFELLNEEE